MYPVEYIFLKETTSTQDIARDMIKNGRIKINTVIVAEIQSNGRGQKDNIWSSPKGGLYFSLITMTDEKNLKNLKDLSITTAKAVKKTLNKKYQITARIKKPNDVYALSSNGYKKISGILIETIPYDFKRFIITGIGVNFNNPIPDILSNRATSIYEIRNKQYKPVGFIRPFLKEYFNTTEKIYGKVNNRKSPIKRGN